MFIKSPVLLQTIKKEFMTVSIGLQSALGLHSAVYNVVVFSSQVC